MMNLTLKGFFRKELIQALRDPRMRMLLFLVPVLQLVVFGVAIRTETRNIRLAVIYPIHDVIGRDIETSALASGWFIPADNGSGAIAGSDPMRLVQGNKADAVLVAPAGGIRRSIERGEGKVQLIINAVNAIRAQSIEAYLQNIVSRVVQDRLQLRERESPLSLQVRVLFNPEMKTAFYLVPGVLSMVLCIVTVILTSMSLAREKELGTFEMLISAPLKTHEILLGKTIPFVALGMVDALLVLGVATLGFGVPLRGSIFVLLFASFIFVCTTVSIGTLISTISRTQQQAMLGGLLFLMPAVLFSGIIFPVENIPLYLSWIAYIDPIQYFVTLLRNIMLKGGNFEVVVKNIGALTAMAIFTVGLSFRRFRHTL